MVRETPTKNDLYVDLWGQFLQRVACTMWLSCTNQLWDLLTSCKISPNRALNTTDLCDKLWNL